MSRPGQVLLVAGWLLAAGLAGCRWTAEDPVILRVEDIPLADICAGKNWRLVEPNEAMTGVPFERLAITETTSVAADDWIIYSAVQVIAGRRPVPIVIIKQVSSTTWQYCELVGGHWLRVQRRSGAGDPPCREYVANPAPDDPVFGARTAGAREDQRAAFQRWAAKLENSQPGEQR